MFLFPLISIKGKKGFVLIQCFKRTVLQEIFSNVCISPSQDRPLTSFCLTHSFLSVNWLCCHHFFPGPKRFCLCHGMTWASVRPVTFLCLWQMPLTFPWAQAWFFFLFFFFAADILNVVLEFEVKEQRNVKTGKILLTTIYFSRCAFSFFKKLVAETFRHFYLALCMKIR